MSFFQHQSQGETFSNQANLDLILCDHKRYSMDKIKHSTIKITDTITRLVLDNCRKMEITVKQIPITGITLYNSSNIVILVDTDADAEAYMEINQSNSVIVSAYNPTTVEIYDCQNVMFNEHNIAEPYQDSTWKN